MRRWPSANISTYFFLGSDMKNIISCEKKIFLLVKLCFSLHFISDFIPLDPDPNKSGFDRIRIRIHITDINNTLNSAIHSTPNSTVKITINSILNSTINTPNSIVNNTLNCILHSTLNSTMERTLWSSIHITYTVQWKVHFTVHFRVHIINNEQWFD